MDSQIARLDRKEQPRHYVVNAVRLGMKGHALHDLYHLRGSAFMYSHYPKCHPLRPILSVAICTYPADICQIYSL